MRSASATKALPFLASRQAAVAIAQSLPTSMRSQSARKRRSAVSALLDRVGGEQPGRLHLAAEAGQHLFVEDRRRAAGQPLVDDEAHRVRADIDDRDRRPVIETTLRHVHAGRRRLRAVETAYKATRRRFFERFATTRQTRIGHEVLVGVEGFLALGRFYAIRRAVGQEFPALLVVLEVRHHDLFEHLLVHGRD